MTVVVDRKARSKEEKENGNNAPVEEDDGRVSLERSQDRLLTRCSWCEAWPQFSDADQWGGLGVEGPFLRAKCAEPGAVQ